MNPSIRQEFEKDFGAEKSKNFGSACGGRNDEEAEKNCALWSVRWLIKRLLKIGFGGKINGELRQIAKEFEA